MLVAIERSRFVYLYKYNQMRVEISQVIDESTDHLAVLLQENMNAWIEIFDRALPLFEQDHEVILLETNKNSLKLQNGVWLSFDAITRIYPLTEVGMQLLEGKIDDDLFLGLPIYEKGIESLRIYRSMKFRASTSEELLKHFNLTGIIENDFLSLIKLSVKKNLLAKDKTQDFNSYLDHLIAYNKTPSYIPEGNVEYVSKIGAIAIKSLGKSEEVFTNGPFYRSCIKYKGTINDRSYLYSYKQFMSISDKDLSLAFDKMHDLIFKAYKGVDIFKASYFFLAFKSALNKNESNIELLVDDIEALISEDKQTAAIVLALLGYTFSIENLYEGLHRLSNAPLLKSTRHKISARHQQQEKLSAIEAQAIAATEPSSERNIQVNETSEVLETEISVQPDSEKSSLESDETKLESVSEPESAYRAAERKLVAFDELENVMSESQEKNDVQNTIIEPLDAAEEKDFRTIGDFKIYLKKVMASTKLKVWIPFLEAYFYEQSQEISLYKLLYKLDEHPEVKSKILKTQKDKLAIKNFFEI
jgi:hypothetical protein